MENNELYHYGILGMHWGVRRTPEQLGHRTKSSGSARSAKARVRVNKKKSKVSSAKEEKPITAEEKAKKKENIMKSRSAKELYANKDLFDDQELRTAYQRLMLEKQIKDLTPKQKSRGEAYVDAVIKWGGKANQLTSTGLQFYKNIQEIKKLMGGTKKTQKKG